MNTDDPILTAYALGECNESETKRVEEAMSRDAGLASEVRQIRHLAALLREKEAGAALSLGPERHARIRQAAGGGDEKILVLASQRRNRWRNVAVVLSAAAVLTLAFVTFSRLSVEDPKGMAGGAGGTDSVAAGESGFGESTGSANEGSGFPLRVGDESVERLERLLVNENRLPEGTEIRLEELVAYPDYDLEPLLQKGGVGVRAEAGVCPWDERKLLLALWVSAEEERNLSLECHFAKDLVSSARLLGYQERKGQNPTGEEVVAFQGRHCVLYEVTLAEGKREGVWYQVVLTVGNGQGGVEEGIFPGSERGEGERSVAWQSAAAIAHFGKGLQAEGAERSRYLLESREKARKLRGLVSDSRTQFLCELIELGAARVEERLGE